MLKKFYIFLIYNTKYKLIKLISTTTILIINIYNSKKEL